MNAPCGEAAVAASSVAASSVAAAQRTARRTQATAAAPPPPTPREQQAPRDSWGVSAPTGGRWNWWPIIAAVVVIGIWIMIAGLKTAILASSVLLCVVAGWMDSRSGRIPNWLTVPGLVAGFVLNTFAGGWSGLKFSLLGASVGLLLLLPFVLLRSLGAGGWKLAGGLGAFVGPGVLVKLLIGSVFVVGVMTLVLVIHEGRLRKALLNLGRVLASLVHFRRSAPQVAGENLKPLKVSYGAALAFTVMLYGIAWSLGWTA
jgi:prepilin peptidase CpaA